MDLSKIAKILSLEADRGRFNRMVGAHEFGNIHQIVEWGEFQALEKMRDKFWLIGLENADGKGELSGGALIIKQKLPGGRCWLYVPRGPLLGKDRDAEMSAFMEKAEEVGRAERAVFLRVEPVGGGDWGKWGFRKAHAHYQPENTLILDLSGSEQDILAQMKPKGRYNIKVAEKKGVKVRVGETEKDWENFYSLLKETTSRDGFSGHGLKYYQNMVEKLDGKARLYLAEYEGKVISGIIVTFFKDTAIYYFGVSGNEYRNVMAPYLLQWTAIKAAKEDGMKYYDFLGVAPEGAGENHEWTGVTDFKLKFGGKRVDYQPAQEKIFNMPVYWIMRLVKWLKKKFKR
ncbi:MAG: lipid II:glycine glycyltransferase FemX [Candidatus Altimarinota bacterium]